MLLESKNSFKNSQQLNFNHKKETYYYMKYYGINWLIFINLIYVFKIPKIDPSIYPLNSKKSINNTNLVSFNRTTPVSYKNYE